MVRSRIIELNGDGEIEGIHQADVIVVTAGSGAGEGELSQGRRSGPAVGTLQLAAVAGRARSVAGAIEGTVPASPESTCDPRHRDARCYTGARRHFQTAGGTVEYRCWGAGAGHPDCLGTIIFDGELASLGRCRE